MAYSKSISPTLILQQSRVPDQAVNLAILFFIAALWPLGNLIEDRILGSVQDQIIQVGISITLAVSLNLINGITGQFSLGHAGFMAIGAYTAGVLLKHLQPQGAMLEFSYLWLIPLGGLMAAIVGIIVGIPSLRLRGDYLAIATLGFGQIITVLLTETDSIGSFEFGGASGLHSIPSPGHHFFWSYAVAVICIATIGRLVYSTKGKPFFAVREDEIAAAAMGVDTTYYKVAAFVIGAFFAGAVGTIAATFPVGEIGPNSFDFNRSILIVMMVVLGGSGSISGSVLAAIVLTLLPEQLRFLHDWRMVIYSLILILMMLLRPEGLLGNREIWKLRRRFAKPAN